MEIKKEIIVKLTTDELEQIISDYLISKGVKVESVHFNVGSHGQEGDSFPWRSVYHRLDSVSCTGSEIS